jgi:carboxyl-terminal processing protease
VRTGWIAVACAALALVLGIFLGGHPELLPGPVRDTFVEEDRALRAEVIDTIEDSFYKKVDESKLDDASLKGIVDSLEDPYSAYITPSEAKQFQQGLSGEFEGVGLNVEKDDRGLRVLDVFEGSPAQDAGIRERDVIIAVNGRSLAGVSTSVATGRIKGPAGTEVELEVFTPGAARSRSSASGSRSRSPAVGSSSATGASSAWSSSAASPPARTATCAGGSTVCWRTGRRGSCSTCAATPAAS